MFIYSNKELNLCFPISEKSNCYQLPIKKPVVVFVFKSDLYNNA